MQARSTPPTTIPAIAPAPRPSRPFDTPSASFVAVISAGGPQMSGEPDGVRSEFVVQPTNVILSLQYVNS